MGQDIWSLLGMLLVVVLILGAAWAVTRMIARQGALSFGGSLAARGVEELYVLRQIPVGRSERLVLVRLHQRCLLLGVAQGGVSVVAELSAEEAEPWLREQPAGDFLKLLHNSVGK